MVEKEIHPSRTWTSSTDRHGREEIDYDCRVEEGRTTRFDIDLTDRGAVRVSGMLRFDGAAPGPWKVMLTGERMFAGSPHDEAELDVEGGFSLVAPKPGSYRVLLQGAVGELGMQFVVAAVELGNGDNPWQLDLETGALEVHGVPANDGRDPTHMYVWMESEDLVCATALVPDANGTCHLPRVPVGPGRVVRLGIVPTDMSEWETLAECEVVRGSTAQATLP